MESQKSLGEDWLLWTLLAVALVAGGGYYYVTTLGGQEAESPWVFDGVETSSVTAIRSFTGQGLQAEARRQDGRWILTGPRTVKVDENAVDRWVQDLLDVEVKRKLNPDTGTDYGFDDRPERVEIQQGPRTHRLYFGGETPVGDGIYVRYGSDTAASYYVLASNEKDDLTRTLKDLRRKTLFTERPGDVSSFTLTRGRSRVTYKRSSSGGPAWVMRNEADTTALNDTKARDVNGALETLMFLEAKTFYDTRTPSAMETVRGHIELSFGDTGTTLRLGGRIDNDRVLRQDGWPPVTVRQDPVRALEDLPGHPEGWPEPESSSRSRPMSTRGIPGRHPPSVNQK